MRLAEVREDLRTLLAHVAVSKYADGLPLYRHYGLYAYRVGFLRAFPALPPAPIERFEALEQLRALWHGFRISVVISDHLPMPGVDTPEDAARMKEWYARAENV